MTVWILRFFFFLGHWTSDAPAVSNALPDVSFQAIRPSGVGGSAPNAEPHLPANGTVLTAGAVLPWWVSLR